MFLHHRGALVPKPADALAITPDIVDEITEELMNRYL